MDLPSKPSSGSLQQQHPRATNTTRDAAADSALPRASQRALGASVTRGEARVSGLQCAFVSQAGSEVFGPLRPPANLQPGQQETLPHATRRRSITAAQTPHTCTFGTHSTPEWGLEHHFSWTLVAAPGAGRLKQLGPCTLRVLPDRGITLCKASSAG